MNTKVSQRIGRIREEGNVHVDYSQQGMTLKPWNPLSDFLYCWEGGICQEHHCRALITKQLKDQT